VVDLVDDHVVEVLGPRAERRFELVGFRQQVSKMVMARRSA
jgi:hypothetical protein